MNYIKLKRTMGFLLYSEETYVSYTYIEKQSFSPYRLINLVSLICTFLVNRLFIILLFVNK